jgi:hypothetical protein
VTAIQRSPVSGHCKVHYHQVASDVRGHGIGTILTSKANFELSLLVRCSWTTWDVRRNTRHSTLAWIFPTTEKRSSWLSLGIPKTAGESSPRHQHNACSIKNGKPMTNTSWDRWGDSLATSAGHRHPVKMKGAICPPNKAENCMSLTFYLWSNIM